MTGVQTCALPICWHICDGNAGTRNLINRFIICAGTGSGYAVGDTGTGIHVPQGSITIAGHSLTAAEVAGHQHSYSDTYAPTGPTGPAGFGSPWPYVNSNPETTRTTGNSSVGKATADAHGHSAGEGTAFTGNNFTALPPYYALIFIQSL